MKLKIVKIIFAIFLSCCVAGGTTVGVLYLTNKDLFHTHSYSYEVVSSPSCTKEGLKRGKCSCGKEVEEILPKLNHNYVEFIEDATCQKEGKSYKKCSNCQDVIDLQIISQKEHQYEKIVLEEATCQKEGKEVERCIFCKSEKTPVTTPKKEHQYEEVILQEATCTRKGQKAKRCKVCQDLIDLQDILQKEHVWDAGVVTQEADCENDGVKRCKCLNCETEKDFKIDKLGHKVDKNNWVIDKEPTKEEAGQKSHHCTRQNCNYKEDVTEIPKLEDKITYNIKLVKTNGEKIYSNLVTSSGISGQIIPQIIVREKGKDEIVQTLTGYEVSVTLEGEKTYELEITGLPEGYYVGENVELKGESEVVVKVPAKLIENEDNQSRFDLYYDVGSVIMDQKLNVVEKTKDEDYTTSFKQLLTNYKGIFLNFFFASCSACNYEMQDFINAYNSTSPYGEEYNKEIAIIMMNVTDSENVIRNFKINGQSGYYYTTPIPMTILKREGWFMRYMGDNTGMRLLGNYPTTIMIDCEGVIFYCRVGRLSLSGFKNNFENLLNRYYTIKGLERENKTQNYSKQIVYFEEKRKIFA